MIGGDRSIKISTCKAVYQKKTFEKNYKYNGLKFEVKKLLKKLSSIKSIVIFDNYKIKFKYQKVKNLRKFFKKFT